MSQKGVIINCTMERVLRFLPPLDISQPDIDKVIETLTGVFNGIRT